MQNATVYKLRKNEWERFATENPYSYICTELARGDAKSFWRSGEDTVEHELMPLILRYQVPCGAALEIGCGLGRLVLPCARHFQLVLGLDIAEGMVSKANSLAVERGITNSRFMVIDDPERLSTKLDAVRGQVDFVYSLLVLQHIDDFSVIEAYVKAISRLLSATGIAYLQFDTRSKGFLYHVKTLMPDTLLPRNWRRGVRRIRRKSEEIERCLAENKLKVLESITPRTALHRYVVQLSA